MLENQESPSAYRSGSTSWGGLWSTGKHADLTAPLHPSHRSRSEFLRRTPKPRWLSYSSSNGTVRGDQPQDQEKWPLHAKGLERETLPEQSLGSRKFLPIHRLSVGQSIYGKPFTLQYCYWLSEWLSKDSNISFCPSDTLLSVTCLNRGGKSHCWPLYYHWGNS